MCRGRRSARMALEIGLAQGDHVGRAEIEIASRRSRRPERRQSFSRRKISAGLAIEGRGGALRFQAAERREEHVEIDGL